MLQKLEKGITLKASEKLDLQQLPATFLICFLNGFDEAKDIMDNARPVLKKYNNGIYESLKESLRILRKVKYS